MQLGNAWYNFTKHSWFMINYGWNSSGSDMPMYKVARARALAYYLKALAYEQESEQRAKLLYMCALLGDDRGKIAHARAYESYQKTNFYRARNCLTTKDLAGG